MKATLFLALIAGTASANPYKFGDGDTDRSLSGRCGNDISNWTSRSTLNLDHKPALTLQGETFLVDRQALQGDSVYYVFDTSPTHTVIVEIRPLDCVDASCRMQRATYTVVKHPEDPRAPQICRETWRGVATRE